VLRGGSFNNQASNVRSANRNNNAPANRNNNFGFRPASTLPCQNSQAFSPAERARVQSPGGRPVSLRRKAVRPNE
jgi:hypothetical protein